MKKFTLGMIAGVSSLALAVPLLAQVSSAQSSAATRLTNRPVPTQACIGAMADLEAAQLANFDAMTAMHKQQLQARVHALEAAESITDDAARMEALKNMHEDMRAAMEGQTVPEAITQAQEAMKSACGGMHIKMMGKHDGFLMNHMIGPMIKMRKHMVNPGSVGTESSVSVPNAQ